MPRDWRRQRLQTSWLRKRARKTRKEKKKKKRTVKMKKEVSELVLWIE